MSSPGVAPCAAVPVSSARAEASRRNGARSRGPVTPEGKARSARNALKHGLRAEKYVVLPDEDAAEFAALEAALMDELAPQGVLQRILVGRIARAAWRLDRAERVEVELFAERLLSVPDGGPGLALIRDGNGTRSFDTLLRYRGAATAEFMRALRTLKALQAEQAAPPVRAAEPAPVLVFEPKRGRAGAATPHAPDERAKSSRARIRSNPRPTASPAILANPCRCLADEPGPPPLPARARTNPSRRSAAPVARGGLGVARS